MIILTGAIREENRMSIEDRIFFVEFRITNENEARPVTFDIKPEDIPALIQYLEESIK